MPFRPVFCALIAFMLAYVSPARSATGAQNFVVQLKWSHQFQFAGFYAALEKGYYAEEGLTVEIRQGGPKVKVNREVIEGRAHFGVLASELIEKRINGEPLVLLAVIMQHSSRALISRVDSGIRTPNDMLTRRIMLNANEEAEFIAMFRREGIATQDLTIIPKVETANAKLLAGDIDVMNGSIANQPYLFADKGVAVRTLRPIDYGVDFYGDSLFTSEAILNSHPEQVAAFRRATLRGWSYAFQNVDEVIKLIRETYNPSRSLEHLRFEAEVLHGLVLPKLLEIGHINPGRIQRIADTYRELGIISGKIDLEPFLYRTVQKNKGIPYELFLWVIASLILLSIVLSFMWRYRSLRKINLELQTVHEELKDYQQGLEFLVEERTKQLRQSQKMEIVGQMAGGVAHDFNNLLGVMIGNAEMLKDQMGGSEKARRYIEAIIKAIKRGSSLTNRLLAYSRQQSLSPQVTVINDLVLSLVDMLKRTLGETVELSTHLKQGVHNVLIDPHQLENALVNLSINAKHAMPNGGELTIETSNITLDEIYADQHEEVTAGDYVRVSVSDSGTGMTPEVLKKVFEPFFTTKDVGAGSGLGLSMVHGFVKQSNGHISIDSEIDRGATINLYLPRSMEAAAKKTTWVEKQDLVRGSEHILVVEDDELLRDIATMILEEQGYQITAAGDGKEAMRALNSGQAFDLLFTDIVLPGGMNGAEIAEKAKRIQPNIKIVYATGYSDASVVLDGTLVPGVTLAKKPYDRAELFGMIRGMLDSADD